MSDEPEVAAVPATVPDPLPVAPALPDLIASYERADHTACVQWLFDAFAEQLLVYFLTVTRSRDAAEELVQDAFAAMVEHIADFDPRRIVNFRGTINDLRCFVIACARHVWQKQLRRASALRHGGRAVHHTLDATAEPPGNETLPELAADTAERTAALRAALPLLRPKDLLALQLRYFDGLELCAIGDLLELSEDGATSRVHRALAKLRELLA